MSLTGVRSGRKLKSHCYFLFLPTNLNYALMARRIILFLLFCSLSAHEVFGEAVPVLLMIRSSEQSDSSGCNFVEQITSIVYKEIIENRLKLWDSQQKEIQITGSDGISFGVSDVLDMRIIDK